MPAIKAYLLPGMLSWCTFVMEKNMQGHGPVVVLHSRKVLSQHLHCLTPLYHSHGAPNTLKKSNKWNCYFLTQILPTESCEHRMGSLLHSPEGSSVLLLHSLQSIQAAGCACTGELSLQAAVMGWCWQRVKSVCPVTSSALAMSCWWQMLRWSATAIHFFTCSFCVTAGGISSIIIHPILLLCRRFTSVCYQNMPKIIFHALGRNAEWNVNTSWQEQHAD